MPTYSKLTPTEMATLVTCSECGATVLDVEKHDGWHGEVLKRVFDPIVHEPVNVTVTHRWHG